MVHDPALDAHESSEHAEHAAHDRDPFIANVSITIAVLAVLAAAAGSLESIEGDKAITASAEAVLRQDQATDSWTEYEAANGGGARAADYKKTADDNAKKQDSIKTAAKDKENDRDNLVKESGAHERRHDWLTGSATITEIGIAISTVAIITKRRIAWLGALGLGAVGFALLGWAYLT
jgi:hypothetical protein